MLNNTQEKSLQELDQKLKNHCIDDVSGHDYDHIKRVVNLTARFVHSGVEEFVCLSVAYVHDIFDHKINPVDDVETSLLNLFKEWDINFEGQEETIALAASQIGYSIQDAVINKLEEAKIVSDADYLDAMGAQGIIRTLQYGFYKNRDVSESIKHFEDKLLNLYNLLHTKKAKKIGKKKHQLLLDFYNAYIEETTI